MEGLPSGEKDDATAMVRSSSWIEFKNLDRKDVAKGEGCDGGPKMIGLISLGMRYSA